MKLQTCTLVLLVALTVRYQEALASGNFINISADASAGYDSNPTQSGAYNEVNESSQSGGGGVVAVARAEEEAVEARAVVAVDQVQAKGQDLDQARGQEEALDRKATHDFLAL